MNKSEKEDLNEFTRTELKAFGAEINLSILFNPQFVPRLQRILVYS